MYRYCPKCGAEYRPGFNECSDCRVALVDEEPTEAELRKRARAEQHELVEVYRSGRIDAQVICSVLEGHGIAAVTDNPGHGNYPVTVGDLGAGRIFVRAEDAEAALRLIQSTTTPELPPDEGDDFEPAGLLMWERGWVRAIAGGLAASLIALYVLELR